MSNRSQKATLRHLDAAPTSLIRNRAKKLLLWLAVNGSIQVGFPVLFYIYLDRQVDYEYAAGIRTSTDGDIIMIPVVGLFIFLFIALLIINTIGACLYIRKHRRQRLT